MAEIKQQAQEQLEADFDGWYNQLVYARPVQYQKMCPECSEGFDREDARQHFFGYCVTPAAGLAGEGVGPESLSLLVIDLGDCCVVKAENGGGIPASWAEKMPPYAGDGTKAIFHCSIDTLQRSLDALADGDKPVPRIERNAYGPFLYQMYLSDMVGHCAPIKLLETDYDALCELAGVTIPIFEPKTGNWTQIDSGHKVFTAWRFTLAS